jgi:hypothetical protein
MIHVVRIYQFSGANKEPVRKKGLWLGLTARQDFEATARDGLTLASRSCSLLKVDPHVLQRHPVIGVRAAFASLIRDGLNDNPSSPPHCKHKRLGRSPLFSAPESGAANIPALGKTPTGGA